MATTEAAAPKTEPVRNLTPQQLRDQKDEYNRNREKLSDYRERAARYQAELHELATRESDARQLLEQTENTPGFPRERELANQVIEKCARADQRPHWQFQLESALREIARLEQAIKSVNTAPFSKNAEIHELAGRLR